MSGFQFNSLKTGNWIFHNCNGLKAHYVTIHYSTVEDLNSKRLNSGNIL